MLLEYSGVYGQFDYRRIVRLHSYNIANDKAYALSGTQTYEFLKCKELNHPRCWLYYSIVIRIINGRNNVWNCSYRRQVVMPSRSLGRLRLMPNESLSHSP